MSRTIVWAIFSAVSSASLCGCGLSVPAKNLLASEEINPVSKSSPEGNYENDIIIHVNCELSKGLIRAKLWDLPWLTSNKWGTSITLTITALDQGGINPGISLINPLHNNITTFPASEGGNVTSPQSFTLGVGASAAANATRTETIQYTYRNSDLVAFNKKLPETCAEYQKGIMIDNDLKIGEFIYDKAEIAGLDNANLTTKLPHGYKRLYQIPVFNTFTEDINFLASFGGNVNPTWKLARFSGNAPGNLLAAQRTYTNDLVITIGPIKEGSIPLELGTAAQSQHNSRVGANAIATSIQGQSH